MEASESASIVWGIGQEYVPARGDESHDQEKKEGASKNLPLL